MNEKWLGCSTINLLKMCISIGLDRYLQKGLCSMVSNMHYDGIITMRQMHYLKKVFKENDPRPKDERFGYYFQIGEVEPRREYLEGLVVKYKEK